MTSKSLWIRSKRITVALYFWLRNAVISSGVMLVRSLVRRLRCKIGCPLGTRTDPGKDSPACLLVDIIPENGTKGRDPGERPVVRHAVRTTGARKGSGSAQLL